MEKAEETAMKAAKETAERAAKARAKGAAPESAMHRSWLVRCALVVAMAALLAAAGAVLCSCGSKDEPKTQTVTIDIPAEGAPDAEEDADAQEEDTASADEDAQPEEPEAAAEPEPEPDPEPEPVGGSTIINLDDPAQYQKINLFLSNFSEIYMRDNPFDVNTASDMGLCSFALWHTFRNSPSLVELDGGGNGYLDSGANGSPYRYNVRITCDRANEICMRYFGRTPNFDNVSSMDQEFCCRDGYVYSMTTNGAGMPEGVTLAKSATDLGDGTVRVDFDIYMDTRSGYDSTDTSLYAMTPDQIMAAFGASGPSRTGSAVVRCGDYNEYTDGLLLVSWEASR